MMAWLASPVEAQQLLGNRGVTFDGTPGLFKTWDAEPLSQGEVFFSVGSFRQHRDPGEITLTTFPAAMGIGIFRRLEIFGTWEVLKDVKAESIQTYRIAPGSVPRRATTITGARLSTSAAPFIDVPRGTGRSDLYGTVKVNVLSQQTGQPFALAGVALGKIPGQKNFTGMNRGLSTGDTEVGFGVLASRHMENDAEIHVNSTWLFAGDPTIDGVGVSDLHHRYTFRAGVAFPVREALEAIGEMEVIKYFGHEVEGLDPMVPVDIVIGARGYFGGVFSIGGGYLASVNHMDEDATRGVRPSPTSGFVVQFGMMLRRD